MEILERLRALGIAIKVENTPKPDAFQPNVWIEAGELHVVVAHAIGGDVLHEAGHLAIIPSRFRHLVEPSSAESERLLEAYTAYVNSDEAIRLGPDHWLQRAIIQAGECEAIAWSYAAAVKIGYPTRDVFVYRRRRFPGVAPFGGKGEDVWHQVRTGCYFGVHGLHHANMCDRRRWPEMKKWLQD